jgi:putative MATE family efflux protein
MGKRLNLEKGSITKNILRLAWPMMIGMLSQTLFNVVDRLYLGRYSGEALAAVGMTFPIIFLTIALAAGLGVGVNSLISRLLGAKKKREAEKVAEHSLLLAVAITLFFTIVGIIFARPLFIIAGAPESIIDQSVIYTKIIFSGSLFLIGAFIINSILRGTGDTKRPMIVMIIATFSNIIIDPLFIFGLNINGTQFFPELGVAGAALATIIARLFGLIYGINYLFSDKCMLRIRFKDFKYKFGYIKDIFKVGLPASIQQSAVSLAFFFILMMITKYEEDAIAAYTIVATLDSVAVMPIIGISTATITIVGFNIGAKNFSRAEKSVWIASGLTILFGTLIGIFYFIFPKLFVGAFTMNPDILAIGISFLRILALFTGFVSIMFIVSSGFQGAGKAIPSLILVILRMFGLLIPFAYLFSIHLGYGLDFIWWAFPFSGVIATVIGIIWFKLGTWKRDCKKVDGQMVCD